MDGKELVEKIRVGEIDINGLQNFFSTMIRALLLDLSRNVKVRDVFVPHVILNTGDDTMWLLEKEYNFAKEPCEITNEQYIYNVVPRCNCQLGGIDPLLDQLSNPYVRGEFEYEIDNQLFTLSAEFRRLPIKLQMSLKYILSTYSDSLDCIQQMLTKLAFVRTFKFVYMGITMIGTYKIPEAFEDQHVMELTGETEENRNHTLEVQIELETAMPVFEPRTVVEPKMITHPIIETKLGPNETIRRDTASRQGYRSFGRGQH